MYKIEIKKSLLRASSLVLEVITEEISFEDFLKKYNNFFYYEALDGHEADIEQKKILAEFQPAIHFHENVQYQVIDKLYQKETVNKIYCKSERIDVVEALKKLKEIGKVHNIEKIIRNLKE